MRSATVLPGGLSEVSQDRKETMTSTTYRSVMLTFHLRVVGDDTLILIRKTIPVDLRQKDTGIGAKGNTKNCTEGCCRKRVGRPKKTYLSVQYRTQGRNTGNC